MISYRDGYKYQLAADYSVLLPFGLDVDEPFYSMSADGLLTVRAGYAWDGPSGPAIDTKNFMRGSLVHDVLYQMIREGHFPFSRREEADAVLRAICREDGMSAIRAWWVYRGVRAGGSSAATAKRQVLTAP